MLVNSLGHHLHITENATDLFYHCIDAFAYWLQFLMVRAHTNTQITTLDLLQIMPQQADRLFQRLAFSFALLKNTGIINGNCCLVRKEFYHLDAFQRWYLAIHWIIQREEAQELFLTRTEQRDNQHIFGMPATWFIVFYCLIYCYRDIRIDIYTFMRNKITLAGTKFWAHEPVHLLHSNRIFSYQALSLFRCPCKGNRCQVIIALLDQIDDQDTKAGAGTHRGNYLLEDFVETQFCA